MTTFDRDDDPIFESVRADPLPFWAGRISSQLAHLTREIKNMADDQAHLDADVQQLASGIDALNSEIAALKAQPAAEALDFTGLDGVLSQLQGAIPAPAPAPEPAPVDPTPAPDPQPVDPTPAPVVDPVRLT